jgi:hypothetical protein
MLTDFEGRMCVIIIEKGGRMRKVLIVATQSKTTPYGLSDTHRDHFVRHIFVALLQGIVSVLELLVVGYPPSLYSSLL